MGFPNNNVLVDSFDRANGVVNAGAGSSIWAAVNVVGAALKCNVISNLLGASAAAGGVRSLLTWGPPYDFQFAVPTLPGAAQYICFWWGIQNPGASYTSYALLLNQGSPYQWQFRKYISAVRTTIVTPTSAFVAGDKVGIRHNGSVIEFWRFNSGSWTQIMSRNDTSIAPAAGPVAFEFGDTVGRVDSLIGGTVKAQIAALV